MRTSGALHEHFESAEIEGGSNRSFGFVFTFVFAVVGLFPLLSDGTVRIWALAIAMAIFVIAIFRASLFTPVNLIWTKLSIVLGMIVTPVVMAVIFFVVFTPMGFLRRRLGGDPLRRAYDADAQSYWITRDEPGPDPSTMTSQF